MCESCESCDNAVDKTPKSADLVTPLHAQLAADDVLLAIVNMHPEETLTAAWIAERSGHTLEYLKACAEAAAKGYTECPGRRLSEGGDGFHCIDTCDGACDYCGLPPGEIFIGCKACENCIAENRDDAQED